MKTKVTWTSREWGLIAKWFRDNKVDPQDYGFLRNLDAAQVANLPEDRQRTISGLPKEVRARIEAEVRALQHTSSAPAPQPLIPKLPTARDLSTEDLLIELARRIAPLFEPRIDYSLVDRGFHPPHDPKPVKEERRNKKHIMVVGPLPAQQEHLRTLFPELRLDFVASDENPDNCKVGCLRDEVILWTKFMSHAHQDVAKRSSAKIWYANTMQEIELRLKHWSTT